jgi:hypothetical protein
MLWVTEPGDQLPQLRALASDIWKVLESPGIVTSAVPFPYQPNRWLHPSEGSAMKPSSDIDMSAITVAHGLLLVGRNATFWCM